MAYTRTVTRCPYDGDRQEGGKNHLRCRWCGIALTGRKTCWCGPDCVSEYMIRADPGHARALVLKRDRGVCAMCSVNTLQIYHRISILAEGSPMPCMGDYLYGSMVTWRFTKLYSFLRRRRIPFKVVDQAGTDRMGRHLARRVIEVHSVWHMDHIIPVVEGGGGCGLDNYRTLCLWCHRKVTAQLVQKLSGRKDKV